VLSEILDSAIISYDLAQSRTPRQSSSRIVHFESQ
jgi:hypothetical protein